MKEKFTIVEYIWVDDSGLNMRSKAKIIQGKVKDVSELPDWTYDGSSCGQATTSDSEIWLKPKVLFRDPFRKGFGLLAICENF